MTVPVRVLFDILMWEQREREREIDKDRDNSELTGVRAPPHRAIDISNSNSNSLTYTTKKLTVHAEARMNKANYDSYQEAGGVVDKLHTRDVDPTFWPSSKTAHYRKTESMDDPGLKPDQQSVWHR